MVHRGRLAIRHVRRGRRAWHGGATAEREALAAVYWPRAGFRQPAMV